MFTSIMGAVSAITEAFKAFQVMSQDLRDFLGWYKAMKTEEWISNLHEEIEKLKVANTPEEKIAAAKSLQDAIRSL